MFAAPGQLLLADIYPAGPPTDGLFFAVRPDATAAASAEQLAWRLRSKHGLSGQPLAPGRFHVTLHHFGEYHGLRKDFVEMASEAAAKITLEPFRVAFDSVMSFRRSSPDWPLVLRGDSHLAALKKLRHDLSAALMATSLGRKVVKSFTPHVTLLYDSAQLDRRTVEPVSWTVNEFVLIHSLLGQTKHIALGRWPLHG